MDKQEEIKRLQSIFMDVNQPVKERQLAMLEEACLFYNSTNRNLKIDEFGNEGGECLYTPQGNNKGCAIGRFCEIEVCREMDEEGDSTLADIFKDYQKRLPEWMQDMSVRFLGELQVLHDSYHNWNSEGLSDRGEVNKLEIVEQINNN